MPSYQIVGDRAVFGHAPGSVFDAELTEFDEARLIKGGHIEKQADAAIDPPESQE